MKISGFSICLMLQVKNNDFSSWIDDQ